MKGHIVERPRGKRPKHWSIVIYLGRDAKGKRKYLWRTFVGKKRDAETEAGRLVSEVTQGVDVNPKKMTVGELFRKWEDAHFHELAQTTQKRYRELIRLYVLPEIGAIPLNRLNAMTIEGIYGKMRTEGKSARTALQAHRIVCAALKVAERWGAFGDKGPPKPKAPKIEKYTAAVLSQKAIQGIVSAADQTEYRCLVYTALYTGLRLSELRGLRREDVDLKTGLLTVQQTCQWLPKHGFIFTDPKTESSKRTIRLTDRNVQRLRTHLGEQATGRALVEVYEDHGLVFATPTGAPLHPSNFRPAWKRIAKVAGVSLRFHDLRHAHASLLIREGAHPKMISQRLGHAGVQITLDTYGHLMPGVEDETVVNLDAGLAAD